jgi:hypothetical protein
VRWRIAVAVASLALSAGACKGTEKHAAPGPTVPTELPATTTTDPYAVPAVIDTAYVNRVLAGLDALTGEAFRLYMRDRRITPEISDRIKAAYGSGELYDLVVRTFEAEKDTRLSTPPGNAVTTVTRLITAAPTCIFSQVARDFRPVGGTEASARLWVGLRPRASSNDAGGQNPTPWIYFVDGVRPDRSEPANPCERS